MTEILSPSNRRKDIEDRMLLFLATGTQQFYLVDDAHRTVTVSTSGEKNIIFKMGDVIDFPALGISMPVSEIWPNDAS